MGSPRRFATAMVVAAAVGAATIGVTAAVAEQDEPPVGGSGDASLVERLVEIDARLPDPYVEVDVDEDWDAYADGFANLKGGLATSEDDLRRLFVDADDGRGEVADAVAYVARGWLDVLHASESFAVWSSHDLAFPIGTTDDDGVATGADDLRGLAEQGFGLILDGAEKHLAGYTALRALGAAEGAAQAQLDQRAADVERFDAQDRPMLVHVLSGPSTTVLVPLDRFETLGPGVESRASSMNYVCVDRDLLDAAERPLTQERLLELEAATPDRVDCGPHGVLSEDD